ncbi:MAG: hypothetical protein U0174_10130 [Polyangiaceae bacterium]
MSDPSQRPGNPSKGADTPLANPEPQRTSSGELTLAYLGKTHVAPAPRASVEHEQPAVMLRGSLIDESEVLPPDAPRELDVWVPGGKPEAKRAIGRGLQLERGGAANPAPLPAGMFQAGGPRIVSAGGPEPTVPETPAAKGPPVAVTYAQVPRTSVPASPYASSQAPEPLGPNASDWAVKARGRQSKSHALTFVLLFALVSVVLGVIYLLRYVDVADVLRRAGIGS